MLVIDKIKKRIEFEKWLKNYPKECLEDYVSAKKKLRIACSKRQVLEFVYNSRLNCYYRNCNQYSKYDLEEYYMYDIEYDTYILEDELSWICKDIRFYTQEYLLYLKYI